LEISFFGRLQGLDGKNGAVHLAATGIDPDIVTAFLQLPDKVVEPIHCFERKKR
jgi:hypothetical protein